MNDKTSHNPNGSDQSPATSNHNARAINRANSQHSTGPRTPEGKQRSSLNALCHDPVEKKNQPQVSSSASIWARTSPVPA